MKKLIILSVIAASLSGCVAVPANNYGEPAYVAPVIVAPVPVYGPGYIYRPAPGYYHHYHYYHR